MTLPATANLTHAIEVFGGGVHRIIIVEEGTDNVVGILSQLRLVKFLWENGRNFPIIDALYSQSIKDLGIGSQLTISVKYVQACLQQRTWNTDTTYNTAATNLSKKPSN